MNTTTHDELVARVVAWHNRHPLARRIAPAQVQGLGMVALPFLAQAVAPAASTAQREPWQAAFTEDFIAPLTPAKVAKFARRHGQAEPPEAQDLPCRDVLVDFQLARAGGVPLQLYLWSAAIEGGSRRVRLLLSSDPHTHIIGPRLWSRQRAWAAGLAAGVAGLAMTFALGSALWHASETEQVALVLPSAAPPAALPAPMATPPQPWPVNIRPLLEAEVTHAARQEAASLRALAAIATPAKHLAAPSAPRTYALAARSTKSRAASELMLGFIKGAVAGDPGQHTEVLPARQGWRATLWPFANVHDAEQARELLAARGVNVEVVEF